MFACKLIFQIQYKPSSIDSICGIMLNTIENIFLKKRKKLWYNKFSKWKAKSKLWINVVYWFTLYWSWNIPAIIYLWFSVIFSFPNFCFLHIGSPSHISPNIFTSCHGNTLAAPSLLMFFHVHSLKLAIPRTLALDL